MQTLFLLNHSLDAVVHILDQVHCAPAESPPIGNVVNVIAGLTVLSVDASDLYVILVRYLLELIHLFAQLRKLNMH